MPDYDKEVLTASALLYRLDTIETDLSHVESDASDLGDLWCDSNTSINNRLDVIESQIKSMGSAQRRMWDLLDDTAELTALLSEAQDGID